VDILEEQGAIVFAKTNIPQTMMSFECNGPLFGRTVNGLNKSLSPGGSSGGEGALIQCFGSCLGVGSDIGGSLRIPSHFCGIMTLKPSWLRLPGTGNTTGHGGQHEIRATVGFQTATIDFFLNFLTIIAWTYGALGRRFGIVLQSSVGKTSMGTRYHFFANSISTISVPRRKETCRLLRI
jgi:amidase